MGKDAPPQKFDGLMNYQLWRTRLEDYLVAHDLWEAVEKDVLKSKKEIGGSTSKKTIMPVKSEEFLKEFEKLSIEDQVKNKKAKVMIRSCLADSHMHYINSLSAHLCLQNLDKAYLRTGTGSRIHAFQKLISLKMKDKEDLRRHIGNIANAIGEYETTSKEMDLEEKQMHLLNSLPNSFENIVTSLESDANATSFEYIISRLLDAKAKMKTTPFNGKATIEGSSHSEVFNVVKDN